MLEKSWNIKIHENPSSGSRVVPCRRTDMPKLCSLLFAILRTRLKTHSGTWPNYSWLSGPRIKVLRATALDSFFVARSSPLSCFPAPFPTRRGKVNCLSTHCVYARNCHNNAGHAPLSLNHKAVTQITTLLLVQWEGRFCSPVWNIWTDFDWILHTYI
jgi:hypothetical protein